MEIEELKQMSLSEQMRARHMPLPSYTQDSLQMLWLAVYLTGFPPAG